MAVSAQTMLDNLETAINNRLTGGAVKSYTIAGRNLEYMDINTMYALRDKLKAEISRGKTGGTASLAEFSEPN